MHNRSRQGNALGLHFGLDPSAEGVSRLSETLHPTIGVVELEVLSLRGVVAAFTQNTIPAAVGFRSGLQVFNPINSEGLVLIEGIHTANATSLLGVGKTALGTNTNNSNPRDARVLDRNGGSTNRGAFAEARSSNNTNLAAMGILAFLTATLTPAGKYDWPRGLFLLSPGWGATLFANADNVAVDGAIYWREWKAAAGERRGF